MHQHIQSHAQEAGYPRLKTITNSMVQKILQRSDIKPFKIKYYCEKRDPDFESKMHDVLVVYKQVSMHFDENGKIIIPTDEPMVHTISCDEKPGIQAIATTGSDLRPMKENGCDIYTLNTILHLLELHHLTLPNSVFLLHLHCELQKEGLVKCMYS